MTKTIGLLPLARPTFDVPFAEEKLHAMLRVLSVSGYQVIGNSSLLMDADSATAAIDGFQSEKPDVLLVLQVTFTDAGVVVQAANQLQIPMGIWAVPEPRLSGRLRLNSFCGLNLASHALGLNKKPFSWMYQDPCDAGIDNAVRELIGQAVEPTSNVVPSIEPSASTTTHMEKIKGAKICRIGDHPDGFDTCKYNSRALHELSGVFVEELEIDQLFDKARKSDRENKNIVSSNIAGQISNGSELDTEQLDKSVALKVALDEIRNDGDYDAFAIRCWPETFTEYGGAVCGPVSQLGEARVPCACEADVYGALTQLYLQAVSGCPVFLADIVDMDTRDDTGVVWHCGQAPLSMADPEFEVEGTIHTNRKMPLLYQFPLKPGPVTFLRISQAKGEIKLLYAFGEMLKRPMAFTGTSGVVRFSKGTEMTVHNMIASGMEHHMALAYGDFQKEMLELASELGIAAVKIG